VHVVDGSGHGNTAGIRVNMADLMRERFGLGIGKKFQIPYNEQNEMENQDFMLGMTKRYDGSIFGLSPLLYWQADVYKKG